MPVYKEGYYCPVCDKTVKAKIWWSNEENELVASCTECGTILQQVIPAPVSKLQWPKGYMETIGKAFSTPLAGGAKPGRKDAGYNSSRILAPAPPQEDTT